VPRGFPDAADSGEAVSSCSWWVPDVGIGKESVPQWEGRPVWSALLLRRSLRLGSVAGLWTNTARVVVSTHGILLPRFHVHYTPTYASWLNQLECWFGVITQRAIRRGCFSSVLVCRPGDSRAESLELFKDRVSRGGPDEWSSVLVVGRYELLDIGDQLLPLRGSLRLGRWRSTRGESLAG